MPTQSGIARFKLVISATRDGVQLYSSVEDLPKENQKIARAALDGDLAATLLIADKAGLNRMRNLLARSENAAKPRAQRLALSRQAALGFLASGLLLLALLLWACLR